MNNQKAKKALEKIQHLHDAWYDNKLVIVGRNEEADWMNHIYSIDSIIGLIGCFAYSGLDQDIPEPKYMKDRR